jgi:TonB-dependent SusC/RagA subfamily outer membrane receptor
MFLPVTGKLPFKKGRFLAKTLLIMKLIAIFIFAAVLQVSASGYAQNITLVQNNVSLKKVFKEIERQSGYSFFYKDKLLKQTENVDVNVKGASVKELLDQCLKNRPLSYTILDKIIVIKAKDIVTPAAFVEERAARVLDNIIAGAVKDVLGNPLSGVSVIIKGSTKGTSTTADGKFTIDANVGDVLEFSIVGYSTKSVTVGSAHEIDVSLDVEAVMGNEVVVVGYGTQKKVNLTGSVAQIKGAEIENRPVSNATRSLEGLVPGLNISVAGNTHPGSSFNLNIRGAGNLSGSDQPYVLVDGVAMSLSDVNPDDIESISVLKDAAASAIYGARAPYGVILVTTKTGKKGRVEVRYSNNIGITSPLKLPDPVNSYDFAQYFNTATFNAIGTKQYSDAQLQLLKDYIKDPKAFQFIQVPPVTLTPD